MAAVMELTEDIVDRFSHFHDSEVLRIEAVREDVRFTIDIKLISYGLDYYHSLTNSTAKTVRITFFDVVALEISDFNHQNVIYDLSMTNDTMGKKIDIRTSFGFEGRIAAKKVELEVL